MSWFTRKQPSLQPEGDDAERKIKTEGLWQKCESCAQVIWRKTLEENQYVCDKCGFHIRLDAAARLRSLFDGDYEEFDNALTSTDPLEFVDSRPYQERLKAMRQATGQNDAVLCAAGTLHGRRVQICSMELKFIGGSM